MMFRPIRWLGCLLFAAAFPAFSQPLIISEIMYRPLVAGAGTAEEWIEIHNRATTNVNLNGWSLTAGVNFRCTSNVTIPAGGYYVIAANVQSFKAFYPGVNNVIGGWTGSLRNSGENIELASPDGTVVNEVVYANEGDWGIRRRGPLDDGHRGWVWYSEHDGLGKSVELVNPRLSNEHGQNWLASVPSGGTPGARNSTYNTNTAPLIIGVGHFPVVPTSGDAVTINARFIDEGTTLTAKVWSRAASDAFTSLDMFDDGEHNDGSAGDGLYGAILPPRGNGAAVEFYVEASDGSGNARTWPAPALDEVGLPVQRANAVYQVDDEVYLGDQPIYRVVMNAAEHQEYLNINRQSDAQMNATFITIDPGDTQVRYLCGFRIRGAGSRGRQPPNNNRIAMPNDRPWKGVDRLSLNCMFSHSQLIGSVVAKRAGLNVADARVIQMRINGQNRANSGLPQFGSYVAVEVMNSDWAEEEFPFDPDGNIYRASTGTHRANLSYYGEDYRTYIANGFTKESNSAENDWSDLINLTFVMSNTPPEQYAAAVSQHANLRQWMTYFATLSLMEYSETSLGIGDGDDYSLYRGINDPRFLIIAHDFDTIFAQGDTGGNVSQSIFQVANNPDTPALQKFFTIQELLPLYYEALYRLAHTTFTAEELLPLFDRYLGSWVPADRINAMKTFAMNRRAYVLSQIPLNISVLPTLPIANGYYQAPGSTVTLSGRANAIRTRFVLVNGNLAQWDARNAVWTVNGLPLNPGVNRVVISTFDENGTEFETGATDVLYEIGSLNPVSGAIGSSTTWNPAGAPYFVSGTLQVNNGATLTISPGTAVYLAPGASIEVTSSGRLVAEGTEMNRIRFTRRPGTSGAWSEIRFIGSGVTNRLVNVDIEHSGATGVSLRVNNSVVHFEGLNFTNVTGTYCELNNSAFVIRNSGFPGTTNAEPIRGIGIRGGGHALIESNYFGATAGLNDVIDFTGGQRPGPILQVMDNVFSGASDDVLDLRGADAHLEGNVFMNVRQETAGGDTASAISGGANGSETSEVTIVRNFFYNCDYAVLAKEGSFLTIVNNTMVNLTNAAVNFDEPLLPDVAPGRGAYFDGNIVRNAGADFENVTQGVTELTMLRSILRGSVDPKLVNTNATLATLTNDLSLRPGSIARGTGPNGLDMGAAVPGGASISGEPSSPTAQTSATLIVGGPGITHYRYQLNGGPYSAETLVSMPIVLSGLPNGTYTVSVVGKNSAGVYQRFNTFSRAWTVNTTQSQVRLNEVLARNENVVVDGDTPDMIELFNPGAAAVDLSGMGVTDDPAVPKKFTFAPGTSLAAGQYLILYADNESGPGIHLGFGLDQNGDGVWLYNANSTLRDSITFGFQAADYSIGRMADGSWGLTRPTFGAANLTQQPADAHYVKINEWLTRGRVLFPEDFVELYNPEPVPADLSGVFLSDAPQAAARMHQAPPLSFIGAYGFFVFTADGDTNAGADHLGFQLSSDVGEIALFDRDGVLIDCIIYGTQAPDVSEGRRPSGGLTIGRISPPTPDAPNPALQPGITVSNVVNTLLPMNAYWRYFTNGSNLGTAWRAPLYDDSAWALGPGMLADETPGVLPPPGIGTELSINGPNGFVTTFYFRTEFEMPATLEPGSTLTASMFIDDGAAVYVNGVEVIRRRLSANAAFNTFATGNATDGTLEVFTLSETNFQPGINYIAVEVHQGGAGSSDVAFGMSIETTHLVTNYPPRGLVINEVMANNVTVTNQADNSVSDWIEFLNASTNTLDLGNLSISDDLGEPRRFVFPPGVTVAPQSYLIVKFDSAMPASTNAEPVLNAGFGLGAGGDQIYLFAQPEDGGDVLDLIAFGVQAADFTIGRVPEVFGPWRLTLPTLRAVNVPATVGSPANLRINEWLANPSGNDDDFVELYNPEAQPVNLSGLHLTDDLDDPLKYRIPDLSFIGVGEQGFVEFIADGDPEDGADHVNFRLSGDGEALGLFTAAGGLIDSLSFGSQQNGVSEGRFPDGADTVDRFPDTGTPGASNMRRITEILINEVLSHTDPPLVDSIELFNQSAGSVDMSGWFLTDRRSEPRKFRIPDGTVLQPGAFVVFNESHFNPTPGLYPSFALSSSEGEDLFLFAADEDGRLRGYRTDVEFGASENGVSFGQYETSIGRDFTALSQRTLGASNAYPKIGPVVITEIMYHPPDAGTNDNVLHEFVELLNVAGAPQPLYDLNFPTNTWRLRDAADFDFPQGVTLPVGGYAVVVSFDPATNATQLAAFRTRYSIPAAVPIFGPYDGQLANNDENVELYKPDGPTDEGIVPYIQVDNVRYEDAYPWPSAADGNTNGIGMSLQRRFNSQYGNDPVNWVAATPTAGGPTAAVSAAVPAITQQPQSRTVIVGATTNFTVTATGQAPLRYQWRFNGVNIPRATNSSYTIFNAQLANSGVYSVLVANSLGAVLSAKVTLAVQTPPSIVTHPQDRLVPPGETAIFTVTAQGTPPLRYQWKFNGANIVNETNAILTISNVQTNKEGSYSVQVSNAYGTTNSQAATLTVRSVPIIAQQPQSTNVFTETTVTFQVSAFGTAPLRYSWRFNDNPIPGETNATLTLTNVQLQHAGGYTVLITNNIGGTLSAVATLTVTVPPVATVAAFDASSSESGSDNAVFTFTRTGTLGTALDIFYSVSGTAQPGADYSLAASPVRIPVGSASAQLVMTPVNDGQREQQENVTVRVLDSAQYRVGASFSATATIADDDNSVPQVHIAAPADNSRFTTPTNINISVIATDADGPLSKVEFFVNLTNKLGEDIAAPFAFTWTNPPVGNYSLTARGTDDVGATAVSAPARIVVATPGFADMFADRGVMAGYTNHFTGNTATYTKEAGEPRHHHNGNGNGTRSAWLSWTAPSSGTVTMNTIGSGYDTVMVIYTNSNPAGPSLANLVRVVSNDDASNTNVNSQVAFAAVEGVTYQIAMDGYSSGVGGPLTFRMNLPNPNPVILSNPTNQLVNPGATVTFRVTAGGPGALRYQWRFGEANIPNATNSTFTIFGAQAADQGIYTVIVSNDAGSVASSPATLSLRPPPSITTPLVNRVVNPGGTATFSVGVSGSGPFTYQWRFNGSLISGATTASLTRSAVQHVTGGTYAVTVSNAAGSTTSQAELIVRPVIAQAALSNSVLLLTIDATPGKSYFVQSATNFVDWADLQALTPAAVRSEFQTPVSATNRLYRLRVP